MSTKKHDTSHGKSGAPVHESVTFEPRDINVATVVKQLIYLGITIGIALLICVPILKVLTSSSEKEDTPMAPVRAALGAQGCSSQAYPPEPRLQGVPCHQKDAQEDLRDKIEADTAANESIGWVDRASGIAKIPVKDAMKIIAERGGAAASSGVSAPEKKK
jgi:hypothetical protein